MGVESLKVFQMSKKELRKQMLEYRRGLSAEEVSKKSKSIVDKILTTDSYKKASCIYAYISTRNEVDLQALIEDAWMEGKRVAVPRVCGQDMSFYYIESYTDLAKGNFGIWEPKEDTIRAEEKDALVLIPGVAYDEAGNRIGYGGGYYDRYLSGVHNHYIIAPAYEFQIVDTLVSEKHDIQVDEIISEIQDIL
ncbi:MAG: 5-formyltetrahydrofolate cyclo-ligase [Lachnospiraceae bacterium]|nr:5-formyltetrahydrofolate cyclo-ligase [Lachnospiraceae bacterium]